MAKRRRGKMTEDQLAAVIERQIDASTWTDDASLRSFQQSAIRSYYGARTAKRTDGLSDAKSTDFADMVEATTAEICPAFDFDTLAVFNPTSGADVDPARIESDVCNQLVQARAGYIVIQEAVRNAIMLRNGIVKIWTDRTESVRIRRYENIGPLEFASATAPLSADEEVEVSNPSEGDGEGQINITVTRTTRNKRLEIKSADPIEFLLTENWDRTSLRDVPMCGEHYYLTESDLRLMGVTKATIKKMTRATGGGSRNLAINARNRRAGQEEPRTDNFGDESLTLYECFELYTLVDYDGDGIAERRRILQAGGEIVKNDPFAYVPYASGTCFLQPQRWLGLSLWDKLAELESQKTEALRQYFDNMAYANNAEVVAVDGAVEIADLKARRPGGINRVDDINAVRDLPVQDHGPSSLALLNYLDSVRAERAGSAIEMHSPEGTIAAATAHGTEREFTSLEALSRLMTKTFGESLVRQMYLLIHNVLIVDFPEGGMAQVGGREFVPYAPADWPLRYEVTVIAGMGSHERAERRGALEAILIQQEKLQQAGLGSGVMADLTTYHAALVDWTAAGGVRSTGRYWIDPRSPESLEAQQRIEEARQMSEAQNAAVQEAFVSLQAQVDQQKNVTGFVTDQQKLSFDYWKATLESAQKEQATDAQYGTANAEPDQVDALQAAGARNANAA